MHVPLEKDNGAFIDMVVNTGIVPRFVEYLSFDSFPELQGESVWVLTNISSGTEEHVSLWHFWSFRRLLLWFVVALYLLFFIFSNPTALKWQSKPYGPWQTSLAILMSTGR